MSFRETMDERVTDEKGPRVPFVVLRDPTSLPAGLHNPVVAIGNFDGVHRGHAAVVAHAKAVAMSLQRPCAVLTFEPHPSDFFTGRSVVFRLTPEKAKAVALQRLGLDGVIVLSFTPVLAALPAEAFVAEILVQRLGIAAAVVGYDFHFGLDRSGSPAFLREAGARYGFEVDVVDKVPADRSGSLAAVHSTAARNALQSGDVREAVRLLGHAWFVIGEVEHGKKLGRTLGFPTANLRLDPSCRLRHGIYAVRICIDGAIHGGVASFGSRPTFDDGPPLLEVFVFDFAADLYDKTVEVDFIDWLRPEAKFASIEALVEQMGRDVAAARAALEEARNST